MSSWSSESFDKISRGGYIRACTCDLPIKLRNTTWNVYRNTNDGYCVMLMGFKVNQGLRLITTILISTVYKRPCTDKYGRFCGRGLICTHAVWYTEKQNMLKCYGSVLGTTHLLIKYIVNFENSVLRMLF